MRVIPFTVTVAAVALGVRAARSRHRRSLHPAGRSFTGELEVWGTPAPAGADLIDLPGRHRVTVRLSKGAGTRGSLPDVLGVAIRVHDPVREHDSVRQHDADREHGAGREHDASGPGRDILLSTSGRGRLTRHLPVPRRSFDTVYGSITAYRNRDGADVYLSAGPDRNGAALGRTLDSVSAAAESDRDAGLLLYAGGARPFGRVRLGPELPAQTDAGLAFDPVRNAPADLRPTGLLNASRAVAYRASQWWRGIKQPQLPEA